VAGFDCLGIGRSPFLPPPESTVNGPFFPPVVRQGKDSILPVDPARAVVTSLAGGLGRRGLNLLGPGVGPAEVDDDGDDFDELVEWGEGPAKGGEGVEVEILMDLTG